MQGVLYTARATCVYVHVHVTARATCVYVHDIHVHVHNIHVYSSCEVKVQGLKSSCSLSLGGRLSVPGLAWFLETLVTSLLVDLSLSLVNLLVHVHVRSLASFPLLEVSVGVPATQ